MEATKRIRQAVEEEQGRARAAIARPRSSEIAIIAVSSAAGAVRDIVEPRPFDGKSRLESFANALGTGMAASRQRNPIDGTPVLRTRITQERREQIGYGDLPDDLISTVEASVGLLVPEHLSVENSFLVAAQVMHIVRESPAIFPSDLRGVVGERVVLPSEVSPIEIVTLNGVVDLTHELTAQYLALQVQVSGAEATRLGHGIWNTQ